MWIQCYMLGHPGGELEHIYMHSGHDRFGDKRLEKANVQGDYDLGGLEYLETKKQALF